MKYSFETRFLIQLLPKLSLLLCLTDFQKLSYVKCMTGLGMPHICHLKTLLLLVLSRGNFQPTNRFPVAVCVIKAVNFTKSVRSDG